MRCGWRLIPGAVALICLIGITAIVLTWHHGTADGTVVRGSAAVTIGPRHEVRLMSPPGGGEVASCSAVTPDRTLRPSDSGPHERAMERHGLRDWEAWGQEWLPNGGDVHIECPAGVEVRVGESLDYYEAVPRVVGIVLMVAVIGLAVLALVLQVVIGRIR